MARSSDIQYIRLYTDGSAARQIEEPRPLPKKRKKPRPRPVKTVAIHVDPLALGGIVVALVMLVMMAVGMARLDSANQELERMESYVLQLQQENLDLQDAFDHGYDLEEVRRSAMALGLVPEEEVPHVQIQLPQPADAQENVSWWDHFLVFLTQLFA